MKGRTVSQIRHFWHNCNIWRGVRGTCKSPLYDQGGLNPYFPERGERHVFLRGGGKVPPFLEGGVGGIYILNYIPLLPDDAVFPHPGAKGAGIEAKEYCSAFFPLDSPTDLLEYIEDVILFEQGESLDLTTCLFFCLPERIEAVQYLQRIPLADDYRPLDDAFQLTHVAGPAVFLKCTHGLLGDGLYLLADLGVEFGDKIINEQRDVLFALPEQRHGDGEHIEPVVKVFAKFAVLDLFFQIPVSRRNDPYINFYSAGTAQSLKLAVLNDPEELALQLQRHLADFVKEDSAAVGQFKTPDLPGVRAGERTPFPPEELTLYQCRR